MTQPWEKVKYEHSKAFYYFTIYRDLGPFRSIKKATVKGRESGGEDNAISLKQAERYSSKYNWQERALAYDAYKDEKQRKANEDAIMEMNKRHADDARTIQKIALGDLKDVVVAENSMASIEGRRNAAARTWKIAVDTERLARGEATEHIANDRALVNIKSNKTVVSKEEMKDMEDYNSLFGIEDDDSDSGESELSGSISEESEQSSEQKEE